MSKDIKVTGALVFPENVPTRAGEVVNSVGEIYDIPAPRVGMIVYDKSTGINYIVRSLKAKVIDGVQVDNAQVDEYEELDKKVFNALANETQRAQNAEQANRQLIANLVGESPETLDTIHEISSWILNDETGAAAMAKAINENTANINKNAKDIKTIEDKHFDVSSLSVGNAENNEVGKKVIYGILPEFRTGTFRCIEGQLIKIDTQGGEATARPFAFCDKDLTILQTSNTGAVKGEFVAPEGAEYIVVNCHEDYEENFSLEIRGYIADIAHRYESRESDIDEILQNFTTYTGATLTRDNLTVGAFYRGDVGAVIEKGENRDALSLVLRAKSVKKFFLRSNGTENATPAIFADANNIILAKSAKRVNEILTVPDKAEYIYINAFPNTDNEDFELRVIPIPLATTEHDGLMSAEDKKAVNGIEERIQGKSENTSAWNDPFKRLDDFKTLKLLTDELDSWHGETKDFVGNFRTNVSGVPIEIFSTVNDDTSVWVQEIKGAVAIDKGAINHRGIDKNYGYTDTKFVIDGKDWYTRTYKQDLRFVSPTNNNGIHTLRRVYNGSTGGWGEWIDVDNPYIYSPLYGKTVLILGGSFAHNTKVYNSGYEKNVPEDIPDNVREDILDNVRFGFKIEGREYSLQNYIAKELGLKRFDNFAYSGNGACISKFTYNTYKQLETALACAEANDYKYDAIILASGLNDYIASSPLGTLIDREGDDTFYASYKKIINLARTNERSKDAKLFMTTPYKGFHKVECWDSTIQSVNVAGHRFYDYVQAIKNIAQYASIPLLDIWSIQQVDRNNYKIYYRSQAIDENNPDGDIVHPNGKGYLQVAPAIIEFLAWGKGGNNVDIQSLINPVVKTIEDKHFDVSSLSVGNAENNEVGKKVIYGILPEFRTGTFRCIEGQLIKIDTQGGEATARPFAFCDKDLTILQTSNTGAVKGEFVAPEGAEYIVVNCHEDYEENFSLEIRGYIADIAHRYESRESDIDEILQNFTTYTGATLTRDNLTVGAFYRGDVGAVIEKGENRDALSLVLRAKSVKKFFLRSNGTENATPAIFADANNIILAKSAKRVNEILTVPDKAEYIYINAFPNTDNEDFELRVIPIPLATTEHDGLMSAEMYDRLRNIDTATKVEWNTNSNMNDFKTPGVYDIYGERTKQDDNLPILNASPGHSIAAKLTVVNSSLRKTDGTLPTEICVTQFLMLSNRKGGDGNMYVRTYNQNNSPAADWWTPWQKLQGIREGYIFTDTVQVNPDGGVQQIEGVTGLKNMVDNGIYSGIYTDDPTFTSPTFIDTFTLIVINNYAVAGQDERLKRTISQLKYAVDAITNQATVKQRTKTDGGDWTDWTDISGGGGNNEVDVTDAVKAYGLPTLIGQGFAKEGVTYVVNFLNREINNKAIVLDSKGKLAEFFKDKYANSIGGGYIKFTYKALKNDPEYTTSNTDSIEGTFYSDSDNYHFYITYIENHSEMIIRVSENMTIL